MVERGTVQCQCCIQDVSKIIFAYEKDIHFTHIEIFLWTPGSPKIEEKNH